MEKFENTTLIALAKQIVGDNDAFNSCHGSLFSFIPPSKEVALEFLQHINLEQDTFPNKHPAMALIADFSKLIDSQSIPVPAIQKEGHLAVFFIIQKLELPRGDYFAIVSPFKKNDGVSYLNALGSISFIKSYLSLFFGKLLHYSSIAEFEFDIDGRLSLPGQIFRMPMYADFFKILDPVLANQLSERLRYQLPEYRLRFQRACNFFSGAQNQRDEQFRFASYWIALEILVGSTDDAIRQELAKAYGLGTNKNAVDEFLSFSSISKVRHQLIHHGMFSKLLSYQERLLQLYFWDIAIHQMGLAHRGFARLLVTSGMVEDETKNEKSS